MKYDLIGDIHGHFKELIQLVSKLGYKLKDGKFSHPLNRKIIFVGDYIDRGKEQKRVLMFVKKLVDDNCAIALMGNHEFNAICYATSINDEFIRPHDQKNTKQHQAFLDEYPFNSTEYLETIEWFKTLPLFFEDEGIKVIHAAWIDSEVEKIKPFLNENNTINDSLLLGFHEKDWVYDCIETLLKGVETELPNNFTWLDKDGNERNTMRLNWFKHYDYPITYKEAALSIPEYVSLPDEEIADFSEPYLLEEVVFFGHYWMTGKPCIQTEKACCLDFSVAKNGVLSAYSWNGERTLSNDNFIY